MTILKVVHIQNNSEFFMINQCFKNQGKLFRGTLKISHQPSCERSQVSMNNKSKGWYPQPYYKDYAYLLHGWYPFPNKEEDSSRRPITLKGLIAPGYNLAGPFAVPHFSSTCLLYTSPSPRDLSTSRMPSSA